MPDDATAYPELAALEARGDVAELIGQVRAAVVADPAEAAIIADLERHGLDLLQLRDVLCAAHVLVDEPELYERWRFPSSRRARGFNWRRRPPRWAQLSPAHAP